MEKLDLVGYVAIAVIIISILSIGLSMTGYATDQGTVNVTIESSTSINFTAPLINFNNGSVSPGATAILESNGTNAVVNGTWQFPAQNLTIENNGNVNVNLTLNSTKDVTSFLGNQSPGAAFKFAIIGGTNTQVCNLFGTQIPDYNTWVDFPGTNGILVCAPLNSTGGSDAIDIAIRLEIPSDAIPGNKTTNIIATAVDASA